MKTPGLSLCELGPNLCRYDIDGLGLRKLRRAIALTIKPPGCAPIEGSCACSYLELSLGIDVPPDLASNRLSQPDETAIHWPERLRSILVLFNDADTIHRRAIMFFRTGIF